MLGIKIPLVQAPIGSATCPELAAAVSNAGALGMLALSWRSAAEARDVIARTQRLTPNPFGVNLVLEWPQAERLEVCLEAGVGIISTFWGDPGPLAPVIQRRGALHLHSVGSKVEAVRALESGVDGIVVQGTEAGGHVRGRDPLPALLPSVLEVAGATPVFVAGGIATGVQAADWIQKGAAAVWVGTRFLCSFEACVHPQYQTAIVSAGHGETYLGEVFNKGWDGAPHRVLRNRTVERWLNAGSPAPGQRPGETEVVAWTPDRTPVERYSDVIPVRGSTGDVMALALYAGMGCSSITRVMPAKQIVAEFEEALRAVC